MRRSTAALVMLTMCAVGACGGGDSGDPPAQPGATSAAPGDDKAGPAFNPCTDITDDEVKAIVGHAVAKQDTGNSCIWSNPDDPSSPSVAVNNPMPAGEGGGLESSKVGAQAVLNGDVVDVSGVGEAAYLLVGTGKTFAKDAVQAQGAIIANGQLILVGITQLGTATEAEVDALARKAMDLVGSKL